MNCSDGGGEKVALGGKMVDARSLVSTEWGGLNGVAVNGESFESGSRFSDSGNFFHEARKKGTCESVLLLSICNRWL